MVKLIGAVIILFSGTMLGFQQAARLSARPQQIRLLIQVLQHLETEIWYGHTPLPEALANTGQTIKSPVSDMILHAAEELEQHAGRTTLEIWNDMCERHWAHTSMKDGEKEVWLRFGQCLGASDRDDQIKHIRLAMRQLQSEEQRAAEVEKKQGKMWKSLGMLAAALIVIMMY